MMFGFLKRITELETRVNTSEVRQNNTALSVQKLFERVEFLDSLIVKHKELSFQNTELTANIKAINERLNRLKTFVNTHESELGSLCRRFDQLESKCSDLSVNSEHLKYSENAMCHYFNLINELNSRFKKIENKLEFGTDYHPDEVAFKNTKPKFYRATIKEIKAIKALRKKGYKYKDISKETGMPLSTVAKYGYGVLPRHINGRIEG